MAKSEAQEMYEDYRERFANMYCHTIEKATKCQAVRQYKAYLERKHKVKIDESVEQEEA